jgi:plastocyanin
MTNKKTFLLIAVILLALAAILWLVSIKQKSKIAEQTNQPITNTPVTNTTPKKSEEPKSVKSPLGEFNPENPEPTMPLSEQKVKAIKDETIQLTAQSNDFSPKEFTVRTGQTVSLTLHSVDSTYLFRFESPLLESVILGVSMGSTRGISFIAPSQSGDYVFFVERAGREGSGVRGAMRVR